MVSKGEAQEVRTNHAVISSSVADLHWVQLLGVKVQKAAVRWLRQLAVEIVDPLSACCCYL